MRRVPNLNWYERVLGAVNYLFCETTSRNVLAEDSEGIVSEYHSLGFLLINVAED